MTSRRNRHRPAYFRMLFGILAAYVLIIGFGDTRVGDPSRIVLLAYLLWTASRLHSNPRWRTWALVLGAGAIVATGWVALLEPPRVVSGVVGVISVVLITVSIAAIGATLKLRLKVDSSTVMGVLCIYLLFALLFASINQGFASIESNYLHGVQGSPTASDLLYFSVMTLATVGYGDITPATEVARAVSVLEALTGQLYLVSVVAGVVAGWRADGPNHDERTQDKRDEHERGRHERNRREHDRDEHNRDEGGREERGRDEHGNGQPGKGQPQG